MPDWYSDTDTFHDVLLRTREEMAKSDQNRIIISSEEFYRFGEQSSTAKASLKNAMRKLFFGYHVKVIIYVREPLSFSKSWYNQYSKLKNPPARFIDFFAALHLSYLIPTANLSFWQDCFGEFSTITALFDPVAYDPVKQFLLTIGAQVPDAPFSAINKSKPDKNLETERLDLILRGRKTSGMRNLLVAQSMSSFDSIDQLKQKIDVINNTFTEFCRSQGYDHDLTPIRLEDILVHDEYINRRDAILDLRFEEIFAELRAPLSVRIARKLRRHLRKLASIYNY